MYVCMYVCIYIYMYVYSLARPYDPCLLRILRAPFNGTLGLARV